MSKAQASYGQPGHYNATPPTLTDGDVAGFQFDINGNVKTNNQTTPAYQDDAIGVAVVEERYLPSGSLATSTQIKASAGFVHTVTISCNDSAPTAGNIDIYNNTAASGTKIFSMAVTTTYFTPFSITLDQACTTGIYLAFTTTADVNVSMSYR